MIIGLVLEREMPNLFFSNCAFRNSPASPGINCNEKPEIYIVKLLLSGIIMLEFFNSICQRANKINQLNVTRIKIGSRNSVLKFANWSEIKFRSEKDKKIEYNPMTDMPTINIFFRLLEITSVYK